ncbi:MAG: site-specific DNA-methyltransferase [Dehalococcoidia bacterium]|nr:MAG: site-specific DNA-methyltransferase [Dehalococcoidia bacterium]
MLQQIASGLTPYFSEPGCFTLYHGDCLRVLAELPPESVDMLFADPPFRIGKADWDKSEGLEKDFAFHRAWLAACRRVLKPDATIWVCGMVASIHQCGLALEELGYKQLSTVVWWKPDFGEYRSRRFLISNHETLIFAAKSSTSRYYFNHDLMRDWRKNYRQQTTCAHCGASNEVELLHSPGEQMGSVWAIPKTPRWEKRFGRHETQKPLDLLTRVIFASTRQGDVVLDPFCGTGTTGIAAYKNGRQFVGIDFTEKYLEIAIRRFQHLKSQNNTRQTPSPRTEG